LIQPGYASFFGALRFLTEERRKAEERLQSEGAWLAASRKVRDWLREYF